MSTESQPASPDADHDRLPPHRKNLAVAVVAFCSLLAPMASTTVLAAVPELVEMYHTDAEVINLSNAFYMLFMDLSPLQRGRLLNFTVMITSAAPFFLFNILTALAPTLAAFYAFRILTAYPSTAFLILGQSIVGDMYAPTKRGTATGYILTGTLIWPALGPFIGGITVNYNDWRSIIWLQTALAGLAAALLWGLLPETSLHKGSEELEGLQGREKVAAVLERLNPLRVVRLYRYPNLLITAIASGALVWNMYSLLTLIRYVLNPRFDLESPLQAAFFYIAPGAGYLLGMQFGGKVADWMVKTWIMKRGGERIPGDRLITCVPFIGLMIPVCMFVYGWSVEREVGGMAVPVVVMFVQGVAQLFCFPALNSYCTEVMEERSAEVVASNYIIRYIFAALASGLCLPIIRETGVGWLSTVTGTLLVISTIGICFTIRFGKDWREKRDVGDAEADAVQEVAVEPKETPSESSSPRSSSGAEGDKELEAV
ncbi:hypothetical protein H2201_003797 [Coniosporium apollinis]|uniref:Major facilitator superfamily (MFS) profile domain-containing protein n=1 Tax=Coniosporium apollinis TaxID=61459 RepID=A0ABQ9NUN1_9PEZI|nr:hypothetical protein H2201_003797 [Coniosporium apollinis]